MIQIITSKWFWVLIVLVSILSALYVGLFLDSDYDYVDDSRERYICWSSFKEINSVTTILKANDSVEVNNYMRLVESKTNKINFPFGAVSEDQRIYWIADHEVYDLSQIVAIRDNHTLGKSDVLRFWIWKGYLMKMPCDVNNGVH